MHLLPALRPFKRAAWFATGSRNQVAYPALQKFSKFKCLSRESMCGAKRTTHGELPVEPPAL